MKIYALRYKEKFLRFSVSPEACECGCNIIELFFCLEEDEDCPIWVTDKKEVAEKVAKSKYSSDTNTYQTVCNPYGEENLIEVVEFNEL